MKSVFIFCLLAISSFCAQAQSRAWIYAPDKKMVSTSGFISSFPAGSAITTCNKFSDNREGVYSNPGTGEYFAYNNCGFYNGGGDLIYGYGSDNFLGVPGRCNNYFSLRWEISAIHSDEDMMVLRGYEWDAALNTFSEITKDELINNHSRFYQKNYAIGGLSTAGRRYFYAAYSNGSTDSLAIFHISTWGNIYSDGRIKIPFRIDDRSHLQMEVTPDNDNVIILSSDNKIYKYNRPANTFSLIVGYPSNTVVSGIEVVAGSTLSPVGHDRLYVSYRTNHTPYSGSIVYYDMTTLAGPTSAITSLPSTVSSYQCGHSEIERGRDKQLYFAVYPSTAVPNPNYSAITGVLHKLNINTGSVVAAMSGGLPVDIKNWTNLNGYLIQSQIDPDDYNFQCYSGCNSDFTYSYNTTTAPTIVTFTPKDPAQPRTYKWTFDGSIIYYGPSIPSQTFAPGCHSATLEIIDSDEPYNSCQYSTTFCLNGPPTVTPSQPGIGEGPCIIEPQFIINHLGGSRVTLEPLTIGSYFYIDWGDGKDTLASGSAFPTGGFKHFYCDPTLSTFACLPYTGTHTICVQTGYPGSCRKCMDVYTDGWSRFVVFNPDPEKPTGITGTEKQQATSSFQLSNLYPNPTNQDVTIDIMAKQNGKVYIAVMDIAGKELQRKAYILQVGVNKLSVSLNDFSNGIYIIQISNENGEKTRNKIIKD